MKSKIEEQKLPPSLSENKLGGWRTARLYRDILTNEIQNTINTRNGGMTGQSKLLYKQLFNFHYADGAKMLTVGGLIHDHSQIKTVKKCKFENIDFVRTKSDPYTIDVPSLTIREIRHIDRQLPCSDLGIIDTPVPNRDLKRYRQMYRYFPAFVDAEIG